VVTIDTGTVALLPPPALSSGPTCYGDCTTADSVTVHRDTIGAVAARFEVGLVSGGVAGFQRHPALVGGWIAPSGVRVVVAGFTEVSATLDTLRAMIQTLRIAGT
jgi:hypothetical protein